MHSVEVKRGAALTPAAADGFTHVRSSYKTRGRAQSCQPNRGPPKSMVLNKNIPTASTDEVLPIWGPLKICLRPDPRGVFKPAKFKKNAKTKYAFCRGKTPFGDKSDMIQGRHQLEDVHSVEVKRGAAPISAWKCAFPRGDLPAGGNPDCSKQPKDTKGQICRVMLLHGRCHKNKPK